MKYLTLLFIFLSFESYSQSPSLTKVINQIDYQNDTLLAVYNWVTDNIKYDVKMAKEMKGGASMFKKGNYKNREEYKEAQLNRVIKKKRGVCQDYTLLFNRIVKELGYDSHIIAGITKDRKGCVAKSLGHTWIAINEDGLWKLYDPTWGAGYVNQKGRFVKKYSDSWYNTSPSEMIERHFPFDPIWQLSNSPISFNEFKKGKQSSTENDQIDFESLIVDHIQKNRRDKSADELLRLEESGSNFKLIKNRIDFLKNVVNGSTMNIIVEECRATSSLFSEYMKEGKSKRFKGEKWTMDYSLTTLLDLEKRVDVSIADLKSIKAKKSKNKQMISRNITRSKKLLKHIKKELKILKK